MSEVSRHEFAALEATVATLKAVVAALQDHAENHAKWIKYLDGQRKLTMDNIANISARMDAMGSAVDRVAVEMADLKAKLDAASVEDPRLAAIADHAAAILDKLNAVAPAPVVEVAAEPVSEQPAQ